MFHHKKIQSNLLQHNITSSSAKYNLNSTLLINWSQLFYISFVLMLRSTLNLTTYLQQPWLPSNNNGRYFIVTFEHCW